MKVIFIGTNLIWGEGPKDLIDGNIYEVVKSHGEYYELTISDHFGYHQSGFAPISEIDETKMTREHKTQLV